MRGHVQSEVLKLEEYIDYEMREEVGWCRMIEWVQGHSQMDQQREK